MKTSAFKYALVAIDFVNAVNTGDIGKSKLKLKVSRQTIHPQTNWANVMKTPEHFKFNDDFCTLALEVNKDQYPTFTYTCEKELRCMVIGDSGAPGGLIEDEISKMISEKFLKISEDNKANCVLLLGDNFYDRGINDREDWNQWNGRFINEKLKIPTFALLGNHDHEGDFVAQVNHHFEGEQNSEYWILPHIAYAIKLQHSGSNDYIKIIFTDTEKWFDVKKWVGKQMEDKEAKFILLAGHRPIYTAGKSARFDNHMMTEIKQELENGNNKVVAYLHGHDHCMQYFTHKMQHFTHKMQHHFGIGGGGGTLDKSVDKDAAEFLEHETEQPKHKKRKFGDTTLRTAIPSHGFALLKLDVAKASMEVKYYYVSLNETRTNTFPKIVMKDGSTSTS